MAKVAYSTQIEYETLKLLNEYIKNTGLSKAFVTDEALKEYIQARLDKKQTETIAQKSKT